MKKWVFGCLGLFIVVAGVGGYFAYKFLRESWNTGKAYVQSFTQLQVVPELNAKIENRAVFTPPDGNALTKANVERFVQAQKTIHTRLGERLKELETKYQTLSAEYHEAGKEPSIGETMTAFKEVMGLFVDGKKAQVDALNAAGYSLAEYEWTRARIYEALGLPIDGRWQQVVSDVSAGRTPDLEALKNAPTAVVPDENRELVEPFAKELTEGAALAFFAL